jgi:hypothetical protein
MVPPWSTTNGATVIDVSDGQALKLALTETAPVVRGERHCRMMVTEVVLPA